MAMKTSGALALCSILLSLSLTSMAKDLVSQATAIKIQGSIFCLKAGNQVVPLPGAKARIECKNVGGGGPFSIISNMANDHGFYTATISGTKVAGCKAFLHASSQWGCKVPTNINGGKKGAPLIAFSPMSQSFSVKPFFYTPN